MEQHSVEDTVEPIMVPDMVIQAIQAMVTRGTVIRDMVAQGIQLRVPMVIQAMVGAGMEILDTAAPTMERIMERAMEPANMVTIQT